MNIGSQVLLFVFCLPFVWIAGWWAFIALEPFLPQDLFLGVTAMSFTCLVAVAFLMSAPIVDAIPQNYMKFYNALVFVFFSPFLWIVVRFFGGF